MGLGAEACARAVYEENAAGRVKGKWEEILLNLPKFKNVDLKNFSFDPQCKRQDVQKGARWIAKQVLITANDLDGMREDVDTYGKDEVEDTGKLDENGKKIIKKTGKRISRIPDRATLLEFLRQIASRPRILSRLRNVRYGESFKRN